jgi:hypothetical protein
VKWATPAAATSGMNVVKARTTFTNVANTGTTFDSVFSSTYADYLVIIDNWLAASSGDDPQMQLLYSGTTQASGYYGSSLGQSFDLASITKGNTNTAEFTFWTSVGTNGGSNLSLYFTRVGDGSNTAAWNGTAFGGGGDTYMTAGVATTSRTYTGIILKSSSGNISGAVTVYGLAKA